MRLPRSCELLKKDYTYVSVWDYCLSKTNLLNYISEFANSKDVWKAKYYLKVLEILFGPSDLDFLYWNAFLSMLE